MEVVVCRICEKKIQAKHIKQHTDYCLKKQELDSQCQAINLRLEKVIKLTNNHQNEKK